MRLTGNSSQEILYNQVFLIIILFLQSYFCSTSIIYLYVIVTNRLLEMFMSLVSCLKLDLSKPETAAPLLLGMLTGYLLYYVTNLVPSFSKSLGL